MSSDAGAPSEQEMAQIQELVELFGMEPVGQLVEKDAGTYHNFQANELQWMVTFVNGELSDIKIAKQLVTHAYRGCWWSLLEIILIPLGRQSILEHRGVFLIPIVLGPLGQWSELRESARQVRARAREWAEAKGFPWERMRLEYVKSDTWRFCHGDDWELTIDAKDMTVHYDPR